LKPLVVGAVRSSFTAAVIALLLGTVALTDAAQAEAGSAAPLRLRWELERNVFETDAPSGRSRAVLTLTNLGSESLPTQGWAIYFNCLAGIDPRPLDGHVAIEQLIGTWFRLRPTSGFEGLGAGRTMQVRFFHPEVLVNATKAPIGPYLVFDSAPEIGHAIIDYQIAPLSGRESLDQGPPDRSAPMTAEEIFRRNETIVDVAEDALPPVFPTPRYFERRPGALRWPSLPGIIGEPVLDNEVAFVKALLNPYFAMARPSAAVPPLHLAVAPIAGQASPEAYELTIDPAAGIALTGNSAAGVARGVQSLRELLPLQPRPDQGVVLPALFISDVPRFEYRGLQLDVARNFQPKATVFKLLDLMARYKLNAFHFHLTDDEGWRLEIKGLPELVTVGARRGHTLDPTLHLPPAYGSGPDVGDPYGSGYYRRADYIEILKYAAARHIEVIPEIEMPGHARAAVRAMESRFHQLNHVGRAANQYLLSDLADKSEYRSAQLYTDNVINPGLPSTYAFIERVVSEVAALHKEAGVPLRTIHVGGDELPNGAWEGSPACLAMMKRQKVDSTAELWNYFYTRVDEILRKQGLLASGWEELGARKVQLRDAEKLIPNPLFSQRGFTVYVWNNLDAAQDLAYRLANAGYRTVLAPATKLYFDMAHYESPQEPGVNWAAYTDLDTVFDFVPFDYIRYAPTDPTPVPGQDSLTDFGRHNIRGLEGTLFTETVRDPARLDYMLMPRMLALAERAWAPDPAWAQETDHARAAKMHAAAWSIFVNQLGKRVLPRLDAEHAGIEYRIPPPGLKVVDGRVLVNQQLPGFTLRYTADGTEPGVDSPTVSAPIFSKGVIQVAAFDRNGRQSRSSRIDNR
jgi:hexosaminidase